MTKRIGVLTSGGDCPGLNAAIRALGKAGQDAFGMELTGFMNGFRGLALDESIDLESSRLSGILTYGGTILGTSRDKPHRMQIDGETRDMTEACIATAQRHRLDAVVCIGGGGTQKNALRLKQAGLNVITLPKTIDNDIAMTDTSFGFDTAVGTATEAVDRLHSTASSHDRVIVVEIMGHRAGWLALTAGTAGGADVILIPEIPYDLDIIADAIKERSRRGKSFSIVAVAEGAMSRSQAQSKAGMNEPKQLTGHVGHTIELTGEIEERTGLESRLTILGHVQRGGTPSAADRVLATWLGTHCAQIIADGKYGVLLAVRGNELELVPLEKVAGKTKLVPPEHHLVTSARMVGTCFGD
ncbi:MAG: ATP-dependent 6-phosphofructokinase [Gemmatimonadota bacterium]